MRHVNRHIPRGMVAFERRCGETLWSGWRSAELPEAAATLVLLHGTGGARHSWAPVLEHLDPSVGILIPDLPGHGATRCVGHSRHGLDDMAHELQDLLRAEGLERIDCLAGHSAGAAVALALALRKGTGLRIGSLLGIAPSLVPPPALYTLMLGPLLAPLVGSDLSVNATAALARSTGLVDRLLASTGSTIGPEQREAYRLLFGDTGHVRGAIHFMAATDLPGLLERLPQLPTQTIATGFMVADDDPWIPAHALLPILSSRMPGAAVERLRGGHMLPEATPQRVAAAIESLMARARANGIGR
jgi:magnesium chelatase accessory protein